LPVNCRTSILRPDAFLPLQAVNCTEETCGEAGKRKRSGEEEALYVKKATKREGTTGGGAACVDVHGQYKMLEEEKRELLNDLMSAECREAAG
jgi:hypothetical protein